MRPRFFLNTVGVSFIVLGVLVSLFSRHAFATGYGTRAYGALKYGEGPSSPGSSGGGSSSCGSAPVSSPDLFQINTTGTKSTLYFAPAGSPYDSYTIRFGLSDSNMPYSASFSRGFAPGVIYYTINELFPNTVYYFQVQAANGCTPGNWGNVLSARTTRSDNITAKYYEWLTGHVKSIIPGNTPLYTGPAIQNPSIFNNKQSQSQNIQNNANGAQPSITTNAPVNPTITKQSGNIFSSIFNAVSSFFSRLFR